MTEHFQPDGGVLYLDQADGALKFKGRSGTVTRIAPG